MTALPILVLMPGPTQAQTIVTPFIGTAHDRDTLDGVRSVYGVAGGYWSTIPVGIEVDFGFHPDFFPDHHPDADHHVVGNISTLAVNAMLGAPLGGRDGPGFRPYITGGLVLFQIDADEPSSLFDVRGTDAGFNIGGGALVLLGDHVGIRGDVRYLKNPRERVYAVTRSCFHQETVAFDSFSFTRATVGFVWRF
jgi:opacity protein-like surface antigen